jgi:hypothetical protein
MVKAVAGSPLRVSLPVFQSSPFEPYTCSYTAVRLMGSRLRGRAVQRTPQGTQLSLGRFRFVGPFFAWQNSSDESPCAVKPPVQPAGICFKSSRFGSAAYAPAFAPLGPGQNKEPVSTERAEPRQPIGRTRSAPACRRHLREPPLTGCEPGRFYANPTCRGFDARGLFHPGLMFWFTRNRFPGS